jgi:hypothetical protein
VYGAHDPKAGAVASVFDIVRDPRLNHRVEVVSGVLAQEASDLLQAFFRGAAMSASVVVLGCRGRPDGTPSPRQQWRVGSGGPHGEARRRGGVLRPR